MPGTIFATSILRVQEILIGIVAAAFVHGVIFPRTVTRQLFRRIDAILTDPKGYFERARRRAEAKVRREMEQERDTKPGPRTI